MGMSQSALIVCLFVQGLIAPTDEPAITIELGRPRERIQLLIDMFPNVGATDPATALANWKRATKGTRSLGKGTEALLAAMNPAMLHELDVFEGSEFSLDFDPKAGLPYWYLAVPEDDGTIAAFATAMVLTDGINEEPLGKASVDRLGPKVDAPLMARDAKSVVIGSSRQGVAEGFSRLSKRNPKFTEATGTRIHVRPSGLLKSADLQTRRIGGILKDLGISEVTSWPLLGSADSLHSDLFFETSFAGPETHLEAEWLVDVPANASLAFSSVLDPRKEALDRMFTLAEHYEKADPANLNRSPFRARIGLMARVAGIDVEADIWPKLRGMSGFLVGEAKNPQTVALALHAIDEVSARKLAESVLPKLAKPLGLRPAKEPSRDGAMALGELSNRTIWISQAAGNTVWIGWGDGAIPKSADRNRFPRWLDVAPKTRKTSIPKFQRYGWVWPARLGVLDNTGPMSQAIERADEIEWYGRYEHDRKIQFDSLTWRGLDRAVKRYLELIPQETAPESRK